MKQEMIRVSKDGITWKEIWIKSGTFNVERKRYANHGYIYTKQSIVTREVSDV